MKIVKLERKYLILKVDYYIKYQVQLKNDRNRFFGENKYQGDSTINSNMDTLLAIFGFIIARYCKDKIN